MHPRYIRLVRRVRGPPTENVWLQLFKGGRVHYSYPPQMVCATPFQGSQGLLGGGRIWDGDWGVLILRRVRHMRRALQRTLRRAIWVIILEQRQYSGTYTHAFFM